MIRSSKPSPLTSPASLTESRKVGSRLAIDLEAVAAVERREVQAGRKPARFAEDHVARPGIGAVRIGEGAPMIRSPKPSPLTSPAVAHRDAGMSQPPRH
jgi:hypothetical protein